MNSWDVRWPVAAALVTAWPFPAAIETRLPAAPVIETVWQGGPLDTGEGPPPVTAEAHQAIAPLSQSALATPVARAVAAQAVAGVSQAVIASPVALARAGQVIAAYDQLATATAVKAGVAAQTIAPVIQVVTESNIARASAAQVIAPLTQSAVATAVALAGADQAIANLAQSAVASPVALAVAAQSVAELTQTANATAVASAIAAQSTAALAQSAISTPVASASASQSVAGLFQTATATPVAVAIASQSVAPLSQSAIAKPYRLWTPANGTSTKLIIADPAAFAWTGTGGANFNGGTNTGSLGGSFVTASGTPTKAAGDANGNDAINLPSGPAFGIAGAAMPAGNKVFIYVTKKLGNPPAGIGAIMSQPDGKPGWALYDQINISGALSNGDAYHPGDKGFNGWGAANFNVDKDIIVTPPADDGGYNINVVKISTQTQWGYSGDILTRNYHLESAFPATTGNFYIGTSSGGLAVNERFAYGVVLQGDSSTDEIEKYEGWAGHKYGDGLPPGHPYETNPPTVF